MNATEYHTPDTQNGSENPPASYKKPPSDGPNIVPTPKKASATPKALP